jgi:hypothetical protein
VVSLVTWLLSVFVVKPKSRAADVTAGAAIGLVYAVTAFSLGVGWMMVDRFALDPSREDLRLLSQAAWAGPEASRDRERLLAKYPDLEEVPADQRGQLFFDKTMAELTARVPLGLWGGMLFVLVAGEGGWFLVLFVTGTLVRRHGRSRAIILPLVESIIPSQFLLRLVATAIFWPDWDLSAYWARNLLLSVLLAVALIGVLRGWPWYVRLPLHGGWVAALYLAFS